MERSTGKIVALKKVNKFNIHEGLPLSYYRETSCLKELKGNEYIIDYRKTIRSRDKSSFYLVLDYCEYDLAALISNYGFSEFQMKSFMKQILLAVSTLHEKGYIHRDLKPSNFFVKKDGRIKLGDFGLSIKLSKFNSEANLNPTKKPRERTLSTQIMTQSYRPPEVLLGDTNYDQSADIFSLACIFYEMLTQKVLFCSSSSTTIAQIASILRICGTPNQESWPGFDELPNANFFQMIQSYSPALRELLELTIPPQYQCLIDLLESMLQLDPKKRITVHQALEHPFFNDQPTFATKIRDDSKFSLSSNSVSPPPSPVQASEKMEVSIFQTTSIKDDYEINDLCLTYPELHNNEVPMTNYKNDEDSFKKRNDIITKKFSKFRDEFKPNRILPIHV